MSNTTDRILYVHRKSKMYITHTHYMELMNSDSGSLRDITLHVQKPISPLEFPLDPDVLHRTETRSFRYNIISIPYHPDWEVEILSEFTEQELYKLSSVCRYHSQDDIKLVSKINKEFAKSQNHKYKEYTEIRLNY